MKHEMLPPDHPTVIGRLIKQLNSAPAGFFACGPRYQQARLRDGKIEAQLCCWPSAWIVIDHDQYFADGDGKQILVDHSL